jgi:TolA-binding protein
MARTTSNKKEQTVRRAIVVVLTVAVAASLLAGCGDFQQRAREAESRIASAEESAQTAEQAAASNTARILELQDRVDSLEGQVADLLQELEARSE